MCSSRRETGEGKDQKELRVDLSRDGLQTNLRQRMKFSAEDKTLELLWRG